MQNSEIITTIFRFIGLVLLQVLVLNNINLFGYINPYAYVVFIVLFPFTGNKTLLIFLGFLIGLTIDMFSDTGGIHAAASVFIAYLRPSLLKFSFGVSYEYNTAKLNKAPINESITYLTLFVIIHHLILFSLEIFNVSHILVILKSTLFSSILSILIIGSGLVLFSLKK